MVSSKLDLFKAACFIEYLKRTLYCGLKSLALTLPQLPIFGATLTHSQATSN
jgi:hypothetical protein